MSEGCLAGLRILIVEDEFLLATDLAGAVTDAGGEVAAMAARLEDAERSARQQLDGAILDMQLGHEMSFDLARSLRSRGVPVVFTTGYSDMVLPDDLKALPRLSKPFPLPELVRMLAATFGSR